LKLARLGLLAAFVVSAVVYIASASPEPASWDTAELQGVPYILGISHPTGFPFYVLLGYAWSHLIPFGSVALRMNAMSGIVMAVACAAAYGVALEFGASSLVALAATFWFAFTPNVWSHAARAEAQDLAVTCAALAIYVFIRWMRGASDRWFAASFALLGLGMAAHPNALWLLPGLIVGAAISPRRPSLRLAAVSLALTVAGLMLYLYLPLRSAYVVAHGLDPTASLPGLDGGVFWNYNDPRTLPGLISELTGTESQTPAYFLASLNPIHLQDALWAFIAGIDSQYGAFALVLLFLGSVAAWRRDWRATLFLFVACTAALLFSVVYPNESDVGRYRLLASWLAVPLLGALTPQRARGLGAWAMHAALLLFLAANAGLAFDRQRGFFNHAPGEGGRWVISAVRPRVPPGSVLVTGWLDATSLAYGAYVDHSLPGRIIVSDDKLRTDLYRRWTSSHRVFVLVDPHQVSRIPGTRDYGRLDAYHELFEVQPPPKS
jgi:4-amino-4-deoxy-L-arabinose transferase-like glycosyltransferase